jgi:hypothetical protein
MNNFNAEACLQRFITLIRLSIFVYKPVPAQATYFRHARAGGHLR